MIGPSCQQHSQRRQVVRRQALAPKAPADLRQPVNLEAQSSSCLPPRWAVAVAGGGVSALKAKVCATARGVGSRGFAAKAWQCNITAVHTVSRHVYKAAAHVYLRNNNTSPARTFDPKKNYQ